MKLPRLSRSDKKPDLQPLPPANSSGQIGFSVLLIEEADGPDSALSEAVRSEAPEAIVTITRDMLHALRMAGSTSFDLMVVATPLGADLGRDLLTRFGERNPLGEVIVVASDTWLAQTPHDAAQDGLHILTAPINPLAMIEILRSCRSRMNKVVPGVWDQEEEGHFVAVLRRHTPVEVVQLKCLSAATTALDFIRPQGTCGRMWFEKGEVVHAEAGTLGGEAAFIEMMNWTAGSIVEIMVPPPREHTIDIPWQALIHVDTKYALTLYTPGRKFPVWSAPAPGTARTLRATRRETTGRVGKPNVADSVRRPGDLLSTESGAAAEVVRRRWAQLQQSGAIDSGLADETPVTVRWHFVSLAVLTVLAVGTVAALLVA